MNESNNNRDLRREPLAGNNQFQRFSFLHETKMASATIVLGAVFSFIIGSLFMVSSEGLFPSPYLEVGFSFVSLNPNGGQSVKSYICDSFSRIVPRFLKG